MVLSSAIVCDHDRRIADDRRSSFHMIADDRRPYCDLRSAIIWKPALKSSNHALFTDSGVQAAVAAMSARLPDTFARA